MYRYLLVPVFVSIAGLLMLAAPADAQKGGGKGGGPGGGPRPAPGARPAPPRPGGPYYGPAYRPGPGISIGIGVGGPLYGYRYSASPYSYSPYYYDPYIVPRYSYYPSTTYYPQTIVIPSIPVAPAATHANIRVLVPDPAAKVFFDGAATKQTGTDRMFHTPDLEGNASYRIRAIWIENGKEMVQEAVTTVTPGQTSVVDFTKRVDD